MSVTVDNTLAPGQIAAYRGILKFSHAHLLATFAAVPDDRLNWKPSETAKSPLQLAAHVAASSDYLLQTLQGNPPSTDFASAMVWIDDAASKLTTREAAVAALQEYTDKLDAALEKVDPAMLTNPEINWIFDIVAVHPECHAAQIDYIQTCYGDMKFHFAN